MKALIVLLALALSACGMTDDEIIDAKVKCESRGRDVVMTQHLVGGTEVRCL